MDEHTTKCDTEMGRNREQIKKIMHPNPTERKSLAESPILSRRKLPMAWGGPPQKVRH